MTTLQRVQGGGVGGGIEDATTAGGTGLASVSISSGDVRHGRQPQKGQVVRQAGRQRFRGIEVREKHAAAPWGSIPCLSLHRRHLKCVVGQHPSPALLVQVCVLCGTVAFRWRVFVKLGVRNVLNLS
jgi:hypothetical protein